MCPTDKLSNLPAVRAFGTLSLSRNQLPTQRLETTSCLLLVCLQHHTMRYWPLLCAAVLLGGAAATSVPLPDFTSPIVDLGTFIRRVSDAAELILSASLEETNATPCQRSAADWLQAAHALSSTATRHATGSDRQWVGRLNTNQVLSVAHSAWAPCLRDDAAAFVFGPAAASIAESSTAVLALLRATRGSSNNATAAVAGALTASLGRLGGAVLSALDSPSVPTPAIAGFGDLLRPLATLLRDESAMKPDVVAWLTRPRRDAAEEWPYWQFVPPVVGVVKPSDPFGITFESRCYESMNVAVGKVDNASHEVELYVTTSGQKGSFCTEVLAVYGGGAVGLDILPWNQLLHKVKIRVKAHHFGAEQLRAKWWDATTNGIRVLYSQETVMGTVVSALETASLYLSTMMSMDPRLDATNELDASLFANAYSPIPPLFHQRAAPPTHEASNATPWAALRNGDVLALTRLDGVDVLFQWMMGSTAVHAAVVLCNGTTLGESCYVCASRPENNYWITANGVQCHTAANWWALADAASFLVVRVPLNWQKLAAQGSTFDANAALRFARANEGVDYAYQTFFFGWVDTPTDNFPCFPQRNFTAKCLSFVHYEAFLTLLDSVLPSFGAYFGGQALDHRLGQRTGLSAGYSVAEAFYEAGTRHNLTGGQLVSEVEEDGWPYYSMRYGAIYNGSVYHTASFVCEALRTGGAFPSSGVGKNIQCAEWTPWELFAADLLDATGAQQLMGDYAFTVAPDLGRRALYPGMGNRCPSKAPLYRRPEGC